MFAARHMYQVYEINDDWLIRPMLWPMERIFITGVACDDTQYYLVSITPRCYQTLNATQSMDPVDGVDSRWNRSKALRRIWSVEWRMAYTVNTDTVLFGRIETGTTGKVGFGLNTSPVLWRQWCVPETSINTFRMRWRGLVSTDDKPSSFHWCLYTPRSGEDTKMQLFKVLASRRCT